VRGTIFAGGAALIVLFVFAPLAGAGVLCLKLVSLLGRGRIVHLGYGAILGAISGKLIDTGEADHRVGHAR